MKYLSCRLLPMLFLAATVLTSEAETLVLKTAKDSFGRSNERTRNSGGSPILYIAQTPNIRTIIAFDLSRVSNNITSATFRFQQKNTVGQDIALTVAPMVQTKNNAAWIEGTGALGARGINAQQGESCYGWSSFPSTPWEAASGDPVTDLDASQLWGAPIEAHKAQPWEENQWVEIPVKDVQVLEIIRTSSDPILTLGLWGTSGNGYYTICSKESGNAPELVVVMEKMKTRSPTIESLQRNQSR